MRRIFKIALSLLLILGLQSSVWPQASQPALSELEKLGLQGRDLILARKYEEALAHFKKLEADYPDSTLGTFGQMAVWQSRMFENFDFQYDAQYQELSAKNKLIVDKVLKNPDSSAWDLFLAGASAGIRGFYMMRKDQVLRALGEANTARKALEKTLQKDPNFADVYLGLGMFDYWRSVFTSRFKFLPFFTDKRAQGLAEVEKAMKEGRVVGSLAQASLAFCYYEGRQNGKAVALLLDLLKKYPDNVIFKNILGDVYASQRNFVEARKMFDAVLNKYPDINLPRFFEAKTYFMEGNYDEARKWYEAFLAHKPPPEWASYAVADLGRLDLKAGKEKEAFDRFKEALHLYGDNKSALQELKKLRDKRW